MFSNVLIIPVAIEKIRVRLTPAFPTGVSATLTEEMIQTPPLVALKTIKFCLCDQKQQYIYLIFYWMSSFG